MAQPRGTQDDFASEQRLAQSPPNVLSISVAPKLTLHPLLREHLLSKLKYEYYCTNIMHAKSTVKVNERTIKKGK